MIFPYKIHYVFVVTLCLTVLLCGSAAALERYVPSKQALSINQGVLQTPFANSILTQKQVDAWSRYVEYEAQRHGCGYLDDGRLEILGMDAEKLEALYEEMIPKLVSRAWVFSDNALREQRQKPDPRPDAPYEFGRIYMLFPGAKITLPEDSGCFQYTRVFSPAETVWPLDDNLPGYIISRSAVEPNNKIRGTMEIRFKVEEYLLKRYSDVRMTIKDPQEPARTLMDEADFAGQYQLTYPFKGLGGGENLTWLQRFYVNKPCAQ